jgi:hypothetical protein
MQQIDVYIRKQYLYDGKNKEELSKEFFIYEVHFPVIQIGGLKYINSYMNQIALIDQDNVVKRYAGSDNINQIEWIKEDILKMYPKEVSKYVVFNPLY